MKRYSCSVQILFEDFFSGIQKLIIVKKNGFHIFQERLNIQVKENKHFFLRKVCAVSVESSR